MRCSGLEENSIHWFSCRHGTISFNHNMLALFSITSQQWEGEFIVCLHPSSLRITNNVVPVDSVLLMKSRVYIFKAGSVIINVTIPFSLLTPYKPTLDKDPTACPNAWHLRRISFGCWVFRTVNVTITWHTAMGTGKTSAIICMSLCTSMPNHNVFLTLTKYLYKPSPSQVL